jgi:hypothetical protein
LVVFFCTYLYVGFIQYTGYVVFFGLARIIVAVLKDLQMKNAASWVVTPYRLLVEERTSSIFTVEGSSKRHATGRTCAFFSAMPDPEVVRFNEISNLLLNYTS